MRGGERRIAHKMRPLPRGISGSGPSVAPISTFRPSLVSTFRPSVPHISILALLLTGCAADTRPASDAIPEDHSPAAGYTVRIDDGTHDPGDFQLSFGGEGLRVLTGPAGIAYRPEDAMDGPFHLEATFTQFKAPMGYREAYGLFFGGRDLEGPEQEYTYFLIRGTGDFLLKRRLGAGTEVLVDWTPHDAVARVAEEGDEPVNVLAVQAASDTTRFLVNGVLVHALPTPMARPYGVAGIRANHRLDVEIRSWRLEPLRQDGETLP